MTIWKVAKDFRHVERMITHLQHDINMGLSSETESKVASAQDVVDRADRVADRIGKYISDAAKEKINQGTFDPLSPMRLDIRGMGGIGSKIEPNILGDDHPLASSGALMESITYGTRRISGGGVDIDIGVPDRADVTAPDGTNPADYAILQELGGVSAGMFPGFPVPPRPFLMPALMESIPFIGKAMEDFLAAEAKRASEVS